jgi:glycolate oxidase
VSDDRWLAALERRVDLETDKDVLESYRYDHAAPGFVSAGHPMAVVWPTDAEQVQLVVRSAGERGVPIVPRGAGSGLSGGANAVDGGLTVCFDRMDRIVAIDEESLVATVEPGVINNDLRLAAVDVGLDYAPDPASHEFSTLGGNIATNAGGLCCVKYGVTREAVLALQVVTAGGELVTLGRPTRKGVAGYDLVALMCGSEGTLGIITEAKLKLIPKRANPATMAASFASLSSASRAISRISSTMAPSLLELLDRTTVAAVEQFAPQGLDAEVEALLFAQSDNGGSALDEVDSMAEICTEEGAILAGTSDDLEEGRMLLAARRLAYPALEHMGHTILDDVCVPTGKIADLLEGTEAIAEGVDLTIGTFGHAGDGNFHPTIIYDDADPGELRLAERAFGELIELALELGGTISGEHGVGQLKRAWLARELGDANALNDSIKRAIDPRGTLNPGKALAGSPS